MDIKNRYILSEKADFDIVLIYDYTKEKFGFNQAERYLLSIEDLFQKLAVNPNIGRNRNEIKHNLMSIVYQSHVIFYTINDTYIRIIRVLHGSQDIKKHII